MLRKPSRHHAISFECFTVFALSFAFHLQPVWAETAAGDWGHFLVHRPRIYLYENAGEKTIPVPPGLDGKIWYLRPDVGSSTRMVTAGGAPYRYLDLRLTVDLRGVPAYLSPTWEQWFDPSNPQPAAQRLPK